MDVVCFGQQNWDWCWTGKQHLMTGLAARGHRVLYVDPDLALETRLRDVPRTLAPVRSGLALREVAPRLHVFTHHYSPVLRWSWSVRRYQPVLARCLRTLGFQDPVCLTLLPRALPHIALLPESAPRVHYAIDEMTAYGGMSELSRRRARAQEETLVRRAHVALGVSRRLVDRFRALNRRAYLLPNAADVDAFAPERTAALPPPPELLGLPRPVLGFVGQVDDRLDAELLVRLARDPRVGSVALVGRAKPGVDLGALERESNIHVFGYRPFPELPRWVRQMDVCLVPYVLNDLTHACSPLKVYEYLAAGRPVVTTPLDGLDDCRRAVEVAADHDAFVAAVARCLAERDLRREERLAWSRTNAWPRRVEQLEERLEEARVLARPTRLVRVAGRVGA